MKHNSKGKLWAVILTVCMIFQTVGIMPVFAGGDSTSSRTIDSKDDSAQTRVLTDKWQYPSSAEGIKWDGEGTAQSPHQIKTAQDLANLSYMVNNNSSEENAVKKVQALIDAMPTLEAVKAITDKKEQIAVYTKLQTAYEAYEALTKEEQAQVVGADVFEPMFNWYNTQTATLGDGGWTYPTSAPTPTWTGSGNSADDPYVITTAQQLADLAYLVNNGESYGNKYFALGDDIDLNKQEWTPIGYLTTALDDEKPFSGTFDGQSHVIRNMTITETESNPAHLTAGLFGILDGDATFNKVINLNLADAVIQSNRSCTGSIAGISCGTVQNCTSDADIKTTGNVGQLRGTGGIVGQNNNFYAQVVECTFSGKINSTTFIPYVGGVVGDNMYGYVADCKNIGTVISTKSDKVGGIVGNQHVPSNSDLTEANIDTSKVHCAVIERCVNTGAITANSAYDAYIGGICGMSGWNSDLDYRGTIRNCLNLGTVSCPNGKVVGGIIGYIEQVTDVKNCYNAGNITGKESAGGIIGGQCNSCTITDTYYLKNSDKNKDLEPVGSFGSNNGTTNVPAENEKIDYTANVTDAQNNSGEIAYLLNGTSGVGTSEGSLLWYQTIGKDNNPVLDSTHKVVYQYDNESGKYYSNQKPNTITAVENKASKIYDGTGFDVSTVNGTNIKWNGSAAASIDGYYLDNEGKTNTTKENSGCIKEGEAPVNVGKYFAKVTVVADDDYLAATAYIPIEITKKEVTVTAKDRKILVGEEIPSLDKPILNTDYTVAGFVGVDSLEGNVSMKYTETPDNKKEGSYAITISGGTVSKNYSLKYVNGTLSITTASTGGGGGIYIPQAPSIVIKDSVGGKATLGSDNTTLTITPEKGYQIKAVLVNGVSKGNIATLTGLKYTDKVEVIFEKIPEKTPEQIQAEKNAKLTAGVKKTAIIALKAKVTKGKVKLTWNKTKGYKVDRYIVYRATGNKAYKKMIAKSAKYYINTKSLTKGNVYKYKIIGVRTIGGKTVYTKAKTIKVRAK